MTLGPIALVAPRNMCFSPTGATSIDLHIHETARRSAFADRIVVLAERTADPFDDVAVRFWPEGDVRRGLPAQLDALRPALIVVHQHLPTARRIALTRRAPVIAVRHNYLKRPRLAVLGRLRRMGLAAVGFVSQACLDRYLCDWPGGGPAAAVTPNGVDCSAWVPAASRVPEILFVGRLSPEKAALQAAEAVAQVLPACSDWRARFMVAARSVDAQYRSAVEAALAPVRERVDWHEDAPHDAVRQAMARAAIVLAPSTVEEAFGRVGLEAIAGGAALVSTRRAAIEEVVGDCGFLLERTDAPALTRALLTLVRSPERRADLGARGRRRAVERFDLSRTVARFDALVEQVRDRRSR